MFVSIKNLKRVIVASLSIVGLSVSVASCGLGQQDQDPSLRDLERYAAKVDQKCPSKEEFLKVDEYITKIAPVPNPENKTIEASKLLHTLETLDVECQTYVIYGLDYEPSGAEVDITSAIDQACRYSLEDVSIETGVLVSSFLRRAAVATYIINPDDFFYYMDCGFGESKEFGDFLISAIGPWLEAEAAAEHSGGL